MSTEPTKKLWLTLAVDGVWADDLDECAAVTMEMFGAGDEMSEADARLEVVTEEWMDRHVVLTLRTIPQGDEPSTLETYKAVIVNAEAVDIDQSIEREMWP